MPGKIDKQEFIQALAKRMNSNEKVASEWLDAMVDTLYDTFKQGKGVTLKGLGGFYVSPRGI